MASEKDLLKQLVKQLDYYDSDLPVNSAIIGSDFLATTIRAWPQFFFGYVLPFPLVQAASFALAGILWADRADDARIEAMMTDEFILTYFALKDADELTKEEELKLKKIADAISRIEGKNKLSKERIKNLRDYAKIEENKKKIIVALDAPNAPEAVEKEDKWSAQWTYGFNIVFQYVTLHWVFWMTGSLFLYAKDRWKFENWHGVNEEYHSDYNNDPSGIPSVLEDNVLMALQFILPALVVIGAQAYKLFYKKEKEKQDQFTRQQAFVLAEYFNDQKENEAKKRDEGGVHALVASAGEFTTPLIPRNPVIQTNFFNTERWVTILSMGTAFWTAFLVGNLLAWPITGGLNRILAEVKHDDDYQMDDEIKILTSFSAIMLGCFAHMYFKYVDMQKELRDAKMEGVTAETVYTPKELRDAKMEGVTAETVYTPTQTFWDYYSKNKRTAINIVLDRMSGSGGILAIRFIFMGGIGGYAWDKNDSDGMDHIKEVMPIALTAMVLMIALNLYQTYYAAQRNNALKSNHDEKTPRVGKSVTF